jgi:hypothetical protein
LHFPKNRRKFFLLIVCQADSGAAETYTSGKEKGNSTPVSDLRITYVCETSELPHFLDNQLTDGGEVVRLTHWSRFAPRKIPSTHFS